MTSPPKVGGLTEPMIEQIRAVIATDDRVERVVLFGSRAKGTFREGSDIDLAVFGANITSRDAWTWAAQLEDALYPWSVDLVAVSEETDAALMEHIRRVGVPLIEKPVR